MHIHLCIVTGQALANLIPLLQEKPDKVVLAYTPSMQPEKEAFRFTLQQAGFTDEQIIDKPNLPEQGFEAISLFALEAIESVRDSIDAARLTWNATGGTKLMALAFHAALSQQDRIIYTNTAHNQIEQLAPEVEQHALTSVLTPRLYLTATGRIWRNSASDSEAWLAEADQRLSASLYLGRRAEPLASLIQTFNRSLDRDGKRSQTLTLTKIGKQWRDALNKLNGAGIVDWDGQSDTINVSGKSAIEYLTGGWLEEYVWQVARQQQLEHVVCSLKFGDREHRKAGQDNEVDIFILHHNRAMVIECKSGYMGRDAQKDSNIIYKLNSVAQQAGGILVTPVLASAQVLQHETRAGRKVDTRSRAKDVHINTIEASQLAKLGETLSHWRDQSQWPDTIA